MDSEAFAHERPKVWLAVSSFRNDRDVLRILAQVYEQSETVFDHILVVDSEPTGAVPDLLRERGWDDVAYVAHEKNLGSGANLRERLRIAAEQGADYVYALNHDAAFQPAVVRSLLQVARGIDRLGAAYPLSYFSCTGRYNLTGTRELPLSRRLVRGVPQTPLIDVFWSSSNGALYSLDPVRNGLLPSADMWMAWEDLDFGWRLCDHGYRQVIVCAAVFEDNSEYIRTRLGHATDKPAWRTYYFARNLILATGQSRNRFLFKSAVLYRLMLETIVVVAVRRQKVKRLCLLWKGIRDGLYSLGGKSPRPSAEVVP